MHARGKGRAIRAHQAGDVRTGHLTVGQQLEGTQHGIVQERTALHDHGIAELAGITQLDDLIQRVAHHRIAQAGGDVLDAGAFLLRLLHRGVHKYGAPRTQVDGVRGGKRLLREFLDAQTHRHGEGLQEGAAAGGACLVHGDGIDHAVGNGEILHVLTADVDHGGDAGTDHFGATVVGHGLHHALVQMQAGGDQALAVTGGAGTRDPCAFRQFRLDLLGDVDGRGQRAALVIGVAGPDNLAIVVHQRGLDGGGAGVDAQEVRALGPVKVADVHMLAMMALVEGLAILFRGEQRRHGGRVGRQVLQLLQPGKNGVHRLGLEMVAFVVGVLLGLQCRAIGHIQVGVGGDDELVHLAVERALERRTQFGHEEQRAAEEDDGSVDRAPGGEAGDGLGGHGREDGGGQIGLGRAVVDQRLQIGLGEHAAARRDRIQVLIAFRHLVESCGIGVEQRGHLIDERAGTARARTVHALLRRGLQIRDLGVLAAKLDDDIRLRVFLIDRLGLGDNLLHERHVEAVGERKTAGTGDGQADRFVAAATFLKHRVDIGKQSGHGGADVGVVATVIGEQRFRQRIGLVEHHGLDCGGTDVQSHAQRFRIRVRGLQCAHDRCGISHVFLYNSVFGLTPPVMPFTYPAG